jgi:penicillin-binding protein 1B
MKVRLPHGIHPIIKAVVALAVLFGLAGAAVFTYFYIYYSRFIDQRLNGPIFANTSRIYAAPVPVFVGQDSTASQIAADLRRAGYSEVKSNRIGWYELVSGGIDVFPGPDSYFQAEAGAIKIKGGTVERIISLNDNTDRQRYDLEPEVVTNLFDRAREKRRLIKFEDIPPSLVNAMTSIEDRNFFHHSGIDFLRVLKAGYDDLRGKHIQGASTLTMQFAGGYFLDRRDRTWHRKIPEAIITLELEQRFSKKEIFEMYMNLVNFGQRGSFSINGIGEASLAYFDKDVKQLTMPEAALLAGIVNGPSVYSPYRHPEKCRQRRNLVLSAMAATGSITPEARDEASRAPLGVVPAATDTGDAPYFVDMVKDQLLEKYTEKELTSSSFKIYTGLDLDLQKIASEAIQAGIKEPDEKLAAIRKRHKGIHLPELQVALICLDPHTGEIKALQGGRSYGASQLNRILAKRQPGSSFKPIVYAAAFSSALDGSHPVITPGTVVVDEKTTFTYESGTKTYEPDNFHEEWGGPTTLRNALAHSFNVATIKVAEMVGLEKVVALAKAAGIHNVAATPSVAIGSYDATPLEMAGAYTMFANEGEYVEPVLVRAVKAQDGKLLEEHETTAKRVLDARVAYMMTNLLGDVLVYGTGAQVRARGFTPPAAGKTGSSRDAWFAGYTSNLLLIVWTGFDDNTNLPLTGAQSSLPIWVEFMKRATALRRYRDTMPFKQPAGLVTVEIDPTTGMLASQYCPTHKTEIYIDGAQPTEICATHSPKSAPRNVLSSVFGIRPPAPPPAPVAIQSGAAAPGPAAVPVAAAPPTATPAADATPAEPDPAAKKKRGFFSKLFGNPPKDSPEKPKPPKPNQ